MRKNIGIITLWYNDGNFGTVIQNWALHQYLQKKFDVNTITIVNKTYNESLAVSQWAKDFFCFSPKTWESFCDFKKEITHKISAPTEIKEKDADIFIIGGDQIINISRKTFDLRYDVLCNIRKEKKILYSAGTSYQQFSQTRNELAQKCYQQLTTNFHALSFREKLDQFSLDTQYIDPSLLLDYDDYKKIEEKPIGDIPRKFDFLYFVRNPSNNPIKILTFFLKNRKSKDPLITNRDDLNLGPKQLIWCLHHCQKLYTNSFHGFVFSIIFDKKAILYNENDFRIKNLINLLKINIKNNKITNYRDVKRNIQVQQQRSFEYFDKNFKECLEIQKQEKYPKIYAAFRKDKILRDLSASGGISALLAEKVFEKKGVVWGASYTQDFYSVHHVCTENMDEYYRSIASSKYSISSLRGIFPQIESQLKEGRFVMFTGTPCQILALKKYLRIDYNNLLTVDLICHGVSKSTILRDYVNKIENEYRHKIMKLNMRTKHNTVLTAIMENGEVFTDKDAVHRIFINDKFLHNMCKGCIRHHGNNISDITLGDFWHIEKNIQNDAIFTNKNVIQIGINKIKVNNCRGNNFFKQILNNIEFKQVS